jgi:drug/metabolite transporter (DMT)-like permease
MGHLGAQPFQVMLGASLTGAVLVAPVVWATGQYIAPDWPLPEAQLALLAASVIHVLVYSAYVWLVGQAGAVFAVQVSYLVTGFGLIWARIILGEEYAPTLWIALAVMFAGMYFVQPRPRATLAALGTTGDT